MKIMFIAAAGLLITASAAARSPTDKQQACWLETSAATMDAALGAQEFARQRSGAAPFPAYLSGTLRAMF
jgi:hypothetical protein